jgi:hypothetical protein
MEDGDGHQTAHIEYPDLPVDYVMEMVHQFYDEYYFRPMAAFRIIWKAIVNRDLPASTPKLAPLCNSVPNATKQQRSHSLKHSAIRRPDA